jgi:GntR family transcriptional regulator, transcriptional repressor for pyruvate dehydrogenase complex
MTRPAVGQLVRAPKTSELIARQLRSQIVRGELPAGDTLPSETELMAQFGVSRPTLREAFRILETESLIQIRRGSRGGAQVTAPQMAVASRYVGLLLQMSGTTLGDVYQARMVLEPACARMFAERRVDSDVANLRAIIDEVRAAVGGDGRDRGQWPLHTYRFHEAVVQGSGNKTLAIQAGVLYDIVATHLSTWVQRSLDDLPVARQRFELLIRSFVRLADLVEAGDSVGAEQHWRTHMKVAAQRLLHDVESKAVVDLFY